MSHQPLLPLPASLSNVASPHGVLDPRLGDASLPSHGNIHPYNEHTSRGFNASRSPAIPHVGARPPPSAPGASNLQNGDGATFQSKGENRPSAQPYFAYSNNHTSLPPHHRDSLSTRDSASNASPADANQTSGNRAEIEGDAGEGEGDGQNPDDPKRPRACEACRGLKVRCDQDPAHPEQPCRRCAKARRQCVVTQPTRKRQKKNDSRVAELEKKLDALTAALQHHQQIPAGPIETVSRTSVPFISPSTTSAFPATHKRQRTQEDVPERITPPAISRAPEQNLSVLLDPRTSEGREQVSAPAPYVDLDHSQLVRKLSQRFIDRINALITPETASAVFNHFVSDMTPHLPAIVFPSGTTASQVLKDKPILFMAILSASWIGLVQAEVGSAIAREAIGALADFVIRDGLKSLELIQAIQVVSLWYKPPENAHQTNFYQLVHMAAVMALDIGLGRRFNPAKACRGFGGPHANYAPGPLKTLPQDSDTLEARRAWLTSYYMCATPNLIRWTNYMKECIEVLETHPDAFPSDKLFCQHVKIQHICEEIGLQFLMDDSTASVSIKDPKVTYALTVFEDQLVSWRENIPPECQNNKALLFFEQVTSLYLHEIALHFNHNVEDFRIPFTEEMLKSGTVNPDVLTQSQMAALEACLKAAHGILEVMLTFEISSLRNLPMLLFFVRCIYALVILIKMDLAVSAPKSELGKIMKSEHIRTEYYLDRLIGMFFEMTREVRGHRPQPKVLRILGILRDWFVKYKSGNLDPAANNNHNNSSNPEAGRGVEGVNQTPLHLLSQVATVKQQQKDSNGSSGWTFDTPSVVNYRYPPSAAHPDSRLPVHAQNLPRSTSSMPISSTLSAPAPSAPGNTSTNASMQAYDAGNFVDMSGLDSGWGTGFEQAMDMALGSMDGLSGNGLDNWFLGDNMAPFAFNYGEMSTVAGGAGSQDTAPTTWQ